MKRSPLRRHARLERTRFRVRSRGATEKRAKGRDSATREGWTDAKLALLERSGGRCEVVLHGFRCVSNAQDPCHIIPRSKGGSDALDNLYAGCRWHHRQQDAPYHRGKLVVSPGPVFRVVTAADKWAARKVGEMTESDIDGALDTILRLANALSIHFSGLTPPRDSDAATAVYSREERNP